MENGIPRRIDAVKSSGGHIQGIAVDTAHDVLYLSFTTVLVKMDLKGNVLGTADGLHTSVIRLCRRIPGDEKGFEILKKLPTCM